MTTNRARLLPVVILLAAMVAPAAHSCDLIEGYFYQVTNLRGTVVGVGDHDFRHTIKWMRHQVALPEVNLSLYAYSASFKELKKARPIKSVITDKNGAFDFGPLAPGHYTMIAIPPWGADRFDVQIIPLPRRTKTVMIDVSPILPDCTGGHEFIVGAE